MITQDVREDDAAAGRNRDQESAPFGDWTGEMLSSNPSPDSTIAIRCDRRRCTFWTDVGPPRCSGGAGGVGRHRNDVEIVNCAAKRRPRSGAATEYDDRAHGSPHSDFRYSTRSLFSASVEARASGSVS